MIFKNKDVGKLGEKKAVGFLLEKGYQILQQNYHSHWGEIDVIAKKDNKICFVEVKTRMSFLKGKPYESVNRKKLNRLMRPIQYFLLQNKIKGYKLSLDVISIELDEELNTTKINHFINVSVGR